MKLRYIFVLVIAAIVALSSIAVAETADIPAELNYQIAVTPDANSGKWIC